jgi:ABC-type branched-subunit amino acid transport system ATPase component
MLAVRANERSAAAAGVNVARVKLVGFAIGAFIAGIGGCLIGYKQLNVTFDAFAALVGLGLFTTAYLAGITSVSGGIVAGLIGAGGLLFVSLDHLFDIGNWYGIVVGVGVVLTVIFNPEGLVGPAHVKLDERRQHAVRARGDLGPDDRGPTSKPVALPAATEPSDGAPARLLTVEALSVNYGGVAALSDVSFSVDYGHIVGLIGPNGAGKTTAMDALCGFTMCRGHIDLAGRSLDRLAPHQRAALGLGRTFQGIDLYEGLSVEENVIVGQHRAQNRSGDQLHAALGTLGLLELRERSVGELSQGQRQLVSIARALAGQPRVVLLDEPAAGLDSGESQWLADRLRDLRDTGGTIVLIDHDMSFVLGLCDEIHVLDFGSLIASGRPNEIRDDPKVAEAYLGATHGRAVVA